MQIDHGGRSYDVIRPRRGGTRVRLICRETNDELAQFHPRLLDDRDALEAVIDSYRAGYRNGSERGRELALWSARKALGIPDEPPAGHTWPLVMHSSQAAALMAAGVAIPDNVVISDKLPDAPRLPKNLADVAFTETPSPP